MHSSTVRRAITLMDAELSTIDIAGLCVRLRISSKYVNDEFRECLGTTPGRELRRRRLRRACGLLDADSGLTLTEVARQVGYSSSATLTRAFRERLGVTPRRFEACAVERRATLVEFMDAREQASKQASKQANRLRDPVLNFKEPVGARGVAPRGGTPRRRRATAA